MKMASRPAGERRYGHRCKHCARLFPSNRALLRHLQDVKVGTPNKPNISSAQSESGNAIYNPLQPRKVTRRDTGSMMRWVVAQEQRLVEPPRNTEMTLEQQLQKVLGKVQQLQKKLDAQRTGLPSVESSQSDLTVREEELQKAPEMPSSTSDAQRLVRSLHTQASLKSPKQCLPSRKIRNVPQKQADMSSFLPSSDDISEQSLLEELFPESSSYTQPHYTQRHAYPKLGLPNDLPLVRPTQPPSAKSQRQRISEKFHGLSEPITALQFLHCSTELTESDFRRLIPKGKHIESWIRDGEFHKVIPGRDPLSLERLPFYYILFKSPEAALAYQNNVARLHKLSGLHQPSSIFSAIPPPKGFLEEGEDLNAVMSSYLLKPTNMKLNLNMVMQPYNPSLQTLIEQGGYKPIVPNINEKGQKISRVLLHIGGWEPSAGDLYHILVRHAYDRGLTWPFHKGEQAIYKLRNVVNVKAKLQPVSSASPRAANSNAHPRSPHDPSLDFLNIDPLAQDGGGKGSISQVILNRLYNRWIIEFEDEDAAKRFARIWNRRVLPAPKLVTWRDMEEVRMVDAEFLW